MRLAAAALAASVLAAAPAHAQAPGDTAPIAPAAPITAPPAPVPADGDKSAATAIELSLVGTAAGVGLMWLGGSAHDPGTARVVSLTGFGVFTLGPSFGQWYAGHSFWTTGLGLRIGGEAAAMLGLIVALDSCGPDFGGCDNSNAGALLLVGGGLLFLGGGIYDIATAPRTVDDWNRAHRHDVTLVPTAMRDTRGDTVPGLALVGRF
jgi:hypothetical protein